MRLFCTGENMKKYIHKYYFMGNYHCSIMSNEEAIKQKERLGGYFIEYKFDSKRCKSIISSCANYPKNMGINNA